MATTSIYPEKKWLSLIISNILHAIIEFLEKTINPHTGKILESKINSFGDILFFLIGSFIGIPLVKYTIKYPWLRIIILSILILFWIQEVGREQFPETWILGGAYT